MLCGGRRYLAERTARRWRHAIDGLARISRSGAGSAALYELRLAC